MSSGNEKFERDFESFLSGDDARLSALYRKLPQAEPDARIDAAVRAMARRGVAPAHPRATAGTRWLPMLGAAAVVALAAGIAVRLGPQLWQRPPAPSEAGSIPAPSVPPPAAPAASALSSARKTSPAPVAADIPAAQAPAMETKREEGAAQRPPSRAFPARARAMREPAPPPATAKVPMPVPKMAAPARMQQQADAASAGAVAAPAARDRNASLYPEHWLANIRQMLRDNRHEEALQSLENFRRAYPDYHLGLSPAGRLARFALNPSAAFQAPR
jgi:hypothetical protein